MSSDETYSAFDESDPARALARPVMSTLKEFPRVVDAIGRQGELAAAVTFLDSVARSPAALVIAGAAGIGKTTIWSEALVAAQERSYQVLACQPVESEAKFAFSALGDLLASVADEVHDVLPAPQSRALAVALLRADDDREAGDQHAVCLAVVGIVTALAGVRPLILAVDDVQWLDAASERVLSYVIRRLRAESIGVVVSSRADGRSIPLGLERAVPETRLVRLELGPLDPESIHRLITSRFGPLLPRRTTRQIHRACDGNPFFALEVARAVLREGTRLLPAPQVPLTDAIRAITTHRLTGLTSSGRDVLRVAAALSSPTAPLVSAIVRRGSLAGLRNAEAEGLVEVAGDHIRFSHPILRSHIYLDTPTEVRRRLHRRLSAVMTDPEERAWHLALGADHADDEVARTIDDAARRAARRGAPEAAAALCRQGRLLTPLDHVEEIWRRTVDEAVYRYEAWDVTAARELLEQVVAAASPGPVRANALRHLGMAIRFYESIPDAAELLRQALQETGDDLPLRAAIELALAWTVAAGGDIPAGARHAEVALALANSTDSSVLPDALAMVVLCQFLLNGLVRNDLLIRAVDLEDPASHTPHMWRPSLVHVLILKSTGQFDRARALMKKLCQRTNELSDESSLPFLLYQWSELECWAGNWDDAAIHAHDGLERAEQSGLDQMRSGTLYACALVDAHLGRVDAARSAAEEGLRLAERTGLVPTILFNASVLAFIDLSLGDPASVDRRLGPICDMVATIGLGEPTLYRFLPDEVEALVELGELGRAHRLLQPFEEQATGIGRHWATAVGARCRGLLLAASGDMGAALATLQDALDHHRQLPMPFELGRTLLVFGTVQRRAKQRRAARLSLSQARDIFDRLGAPLWVKKANTELHRISSRAPNTSDLTPSEQRVADRVADGLTNRQVADALFITVATVEATLWKIYRKLGVRSRTELALRLIGSRTPGGVGDPGRAGE